MAPHSSTLAWKIPWTEEPWQTAVHGAAKSWTWLSDFTFTFHFYALEKEMATHSSVLAWRIPGMGSHRVGHDWSDLAVAEIQLGLPRWRSSKEAAYQCRRCRRQGFDPCRFPSRQEPLEEKMAIHPSILAWRIPWTEESGGLQSIGSQRVGHNSVTKQQQRYNR